MTKLKTENLKRGPSTIGASFAVTSPLLAVDLPTLPVLRVNKVRAMVKRVAHARPWLKLARALARPLPDRLYLALSYLMYFRRWPDYKNPRTFTEHTHAYMLNCRDPMLQIAADKGATRKYVADAVGDQYLVPCVGIWSRVEQIPLKQIQIPYVLKATVGSGMVLFVDPRSPLDEERIRAVLHRWLNTDYSRLHREWAYQRLPREIIAEHALIDERGDIPADYKAYVIGGKVRFIQVDRSRFSGHTRNLYSRDWELLPVRLTLQNHPTDARPERLNELVEVAERLAEPFQFLRVDFYISKEWLYVGELTNYSGAGFERFIPGSFDEELATYWKVDKKH